MIGRRLLALGLAAALLAACAAPPPPRVVPPAGTDPTAPEPRWGALRFRFPWPPGGDPAWHLDLLFADRVLRPILEREARGILLWRLHRRAVRDGAGHQLSLLFFADPGTARRVLAAAAAHPLVARAREAGRLTEFLAEQTASARLADTSDPSWPEVLRAAWPHYIAGASRMWLELVHAFSPPGEPCGAAEDLDLLERGYRETAARLDALWQEEGLHAFLHHLNALFGYAPIVVIEERRLRF